jgi:organic radical activating enzyme
MTHKVRFMGINRDTETAGPGKRLEFFTKGCIRGVISPCEGCFNESTWTFAGQYRELSVDEIVEICYDTAWNRQVTFCGGEPILQARALSDVAKRLKEMDPTFHFVMYTAYKLDTLMKHGLQFTWLPKYGEPMKESLIESSNHYETFYEDDEETIKKIVFTTLSSDDVKEIMKHIDLIVDGDYKHKQRLTTDQYMHNGWFIGSANQRVIDGPSSVEAGKLDFVFADEYNQIRLSSNHCRACGHTLSRDSKLFCNSSCYTNFSKRSKELALMGGV